MSIRILLLCLLAISPIVAADHTPEDLLCQGLFEEEANHDLDKAAENYRAVIAVHDRQRALAASATFRLGEIARKKNDNEAAAAAFRTVVERFPEQEEIVRLSRENLTALGMAPAGESPAVALTNDPEDAEIAKLKDLARNSPDLIDGAGSDGWRPLHHAAAMGWTRVVSYLLENHADPNSRTVTEQLTPLQLASIHGYLGSVNALIAAKADVNATFEIGRCPEGVLPVVDRKAKGAKGTWTALDLAILYDRREVVRTLIEAGTKLTRSGPSVTFYSEGLTPLSLAIFFQRNDLANALIEAGSPLGLAGSERPITPLGIAVLHNQEMVAPLLKAGADPKLSYFKEKLTPLHSAVATNRIETAKLLMDAGADVNARDAEGSTPIHWVSSPELVDLLVSKGADPNAKTAAGLTPLDLIVARSDPSTALIEALLKHGATVENPIVLLHRSSEENLTAVRDLIVYPGAYLPDAILLSVSGNYSLTEARPASRPGMPPMGVPPPGVSSAQNPPDLVTLETRPSPASPPPSLEELLCETFCSQDPLSSIRILRHDEDAGFKPIRDWSFASGAPLPEDWPALQWGNIVEVRITDMRSSDGKASPSIAALTPRIPARTVTFNMGGLEIPKTISGNGTFWLDSSSKQTLPKLIPNIGEIADLSRFVIHRKGNLEPITLDFAKPTQTRFRLIDGDRIDLMLNLESLDQTFGKSDPVTALNFNRRINFRNFNGQSFISILSNIDGTDASDFQKTLILRRDEIVG